MSLLLGGLSEFRLWCAFRSVDLGVMVGSMANVAGLAFLVADGTISWSSLIRLRLQA